MGITWSKQWGLRFYRNGVLTAESTQPVRIPYEFKDKFPNFNIGRDSSNSPLPRGCHLQIADLRIWESVIPQQKMADIHINAGNQVLHKKSHS